MKKRLFSMILAISLVVSLVAAMPIAASASDGSTPISSSDITKIIDKWYSQCGGSTAYYWNRYDNNLSKSESRLIANFENGDFTPAGIGLTTTRNSLDGNKFANCYSCKGFAAMISYCLFGSKSLSKNADKGWRKYTASEINYSFLPGDEVWTSGHAAIVWHVDGDKVYFMDVWGSNGQESKRDNSHCARLHFGGFGGGSYSTVSSLKSKGITEVWRNISGKTTTSIKSMLCDKSHCGSDGICTNKACSNYGKIYPYAEIVKSFGVVTTDYAYVQSQPYGDSSYRLRTIQKGTSLLVTASAENIFGMVWYKIGDGEWICSDRCQVTQSPGNTPSPSDTEAPALQTKACYMTVNVGAGSNLRFCSYVSTADKYYIGKIDDGEKVYVYGTTVNQYEDRTWAKINYNGKDGWVNYKWLASIPVESSTPSVQYDTPDVWLSNDHFDIDLNGDIYRYVSYGYSGNTQYGYYLVKNVEGDSCIEPTWQDGEQIKIQAYSEGQATLVLRIVEYETGRTLDSARCTVTVTSAEFAELIQIDPDSEFSISDDPLMESAERIEFPRVTLYNQGQFTDVPANQWYTDSVASAYCFGLMKGNSATTFNPYGNVTLAEAITMAARIHSIYSTGSENFEQSGGSAWYQCYLDYAYEKDIISYDFYYNDLSRPATRAQYAVIFANALPEAALAEINCIDDGIIPDVSMHSDYAIYVYLLYRAGILTGSDATGKFSPDTFITRAESAAIVSRMACSDKRVSFSLGSAGKA